MGILVPLLLFISISKASQNQNKLKNQPYENMDLEAFEDEHNRVLSTDDKKKILNFLKSFNSPKKTPTSMRLIHDASEYCKTFRTCKECSNSKWYPCVWCHNYGCTDQAEKLCPYTVIKPDLKQSNSTVNLCPKIEHQGAILVPAGVRHNLQVKIYTTDPILYDKEIICQIQFSNRLSHLKALILDDVVYCYPVKLDTAIEGETNMGFLRLIWGGVQPFSNKVAVAVYKCEYLAKDCETCRLIPPEYGCGWCADMSKCVIADKCADLLIWNVNRLTCQSLGKKMFYV